MEHPQDLWTSLMSITGQDAAPSVPSVRTCPSPSQNKQLKYLPLFYFGSGGSWQWSVLRSYQPIPDEHDSHVSGLGVHVPFPWSLRWKLLPRAPAPHYVPGGCQEPSALQPQPQLFVRVWHSTGKQGVGRAGSTPAGPCARHQPGQAGGPSPHQLFTSVFIEGNVLNNGWWDVAGPLESWPRCR